jgi:hypothetical protein
MSNERIDLTQFEGITVGPWHFCLPYNAETDTYEGDAQMKGGGDRVNGPVVLSQYQFARGTANQRADLRAMESCPDLIAELKRCYERIDELEKEPSVTIDEWDIPSQGPCVTVRYNGREYVGTLDEWDTSEEE